MVFCDKLKNIRSSVYILFSLYCKKSFTFSVITSVNAHWSKRAFFWLYYTYTQLQIKEINLVFVKTYVLVTRHPLCVQLNLQTVIQNDRKGTQTVNAQVYVTVDKSFLSQMEYFGMYRINVSMTASIIASLKKIMN